jgi:hypothetical protein
MQTARGFRLASRSVDLFDVLKLKNNNTNNKNRCVKSPKMIIAEKLYFTYRQQEARIVQFKFHI